MDALYDWKAERDSIAALAHARGVPAEQWPGHHGIYCANLEGFLGGRFPSLLQQRDDLVAEVERLLEALEQIRNAGPSWPLSHTVAEEALRAC